MLLEDKLGLKAASSTEGASTSTDDAASGAEWEAEVGESAWGGLVPAAMLIELDMASLGLLSADEPGPPGMCALCGRQPPSSSSSAPV